MNKRDYYIKKINETPITSSAEIILDNLDEAELIQGDNGVMVENEHGTEFELDELSKIELETFAMTLGIPMVFDYVIMTETNKWISTGKNQSQKELDDEIRLMEEEYPDEKLVIFKADEFESYTI